MIFSKKVVLLGDSSVGKTSLIRRFVQDEFDDSYVVTIGTKVSKKQLTVPKNGKDVKVTLMVWDVIGTKGYSSVHARTFAGVHGAIIVSDMTKKETLESVESYWIPNLKLVVESVPMVFACNKSDLKDQRAFDEYDIRKVALKHNIGFRESLPPNLHTCYATSAKTGENVNSVFQSLAHMMLSEKVVEDPTKEIFESIVATGMARTSDKGTLIGALDAIMVDVAEGLNDEKKAMSLIANEVKKAGIDVRSPTQDGLQKLVENLETAEKDIFNTRKAKANKERRLQWVAGAK